MVSYSMLKPECANRFSSSQLAFKCQYRNIAKYKRILWHETPQAHTTEMCEVKQRENLFQLHI